MEVTIYVYVKPTEDRLIYKTFAAAERACRVGGEIQQWTAAADSERFQLTQIWYRHQAGLLTEVIR